MRTLLLLTLLPILVAAGCGGSSSTSPDMQSAGPDLAASSCAQTVATYCGSASCVQDLATAQQASTWCPGAGATNVASAAVQHCGGGQTVIVVTYADSADHLVYASGALVAVFTSLPHDTTSLVCVAGPTTFAAPSLCDTPTTICTNP